MGATACPDPARTTLRMADRVAFAGDATLVPSNRCNDRAVVTRWGSEIARLDPLKSRTAEAQPCLAGDVSGSGDVTPAAMPCPAPGGQKAPCARPGRGRHDNRAPSLPRRVANPRRICRCARGRVRHVIGDKACGDASELCGVPQYVAHARQAFLWSTEARFLRHIFWRG